MHRSTISALGDRPFGTRHVSIQNIPVIMHVIAIRFKMRPKHPGLFSGSSSIPRSYPGGGEGQTEVPLALPAPTPSRVESEYDFRDHTPGMGNDPDDCRVAILEVYGLSGMVAMTILIPALAVAFAAFCTWLTVRIVNRRERWAKWTLTLVVGLPVLYVASFGPACWIEARHGARRTFVTTAYAPLFSDGFPRAWRQMLSRYVNLLMPDGISADIGPWGVDWWGTRAAFRAIR